MRAAGVCAAGVLLLAGAVRGLEWTPALRLEAAGGQVFLRGRGPALSGIAGWLAAPALRLSERDLLIGSLSGQYRRTTEVREFAGGAALSAEAVDTVLAGRWVRRLPAGWSLKPNLSYKNELVAGSPAEALGRGTFDYHKLSLGVEGERRGGRLRSLRPAFSAYRVLYYHYRPPASLDYGLELRSGGRALDFDAYDLSLAAEVEGWEGAAFTGSALGSYRSFGSQPIAGPGGVLGPGVRRDLFGSGALGARLRLPRASAAATTTAGLELAYSLLDSDQNSFDAVRGRLNPSAYDYGELAVRPALFASRGRLRAALAYEYAFRDYARRPAQDPDGTYRSEAVRLELHTLGCTASYALGGGLALQTLAGARWAESNTRFEGAYRYDYRYAYYFLGLSYAR